MTLHGLVIGAAASATAAATIGVAILSYRVLYLGLTRPAEAMSVAALMSIVWVGLSMFVLAAAVVIIHWREQFDHDESAAP